MERSAEKIEAGAEWTLTARWILPVAGPPLENGTVTIRGERIVAVEPCGVRQVDVDLGHTAVLPGFVNAHTHLDLSGMRGQAPPGADFTDWLRAVIRYRRSRSPEQVENDVRAGLAESLHHGTTLLGDISGQGESWSILDHAPLRAVVFRELLGLTAERAAASLEIGREWLKSRTATPTCRPGLSPHAPYSVRSDLLYGCARLAQEASCPLAIHLAESRAELALLEQHSGPFVDFLKEVGVWDPHGLVGSPAEVMRLCAGVALPLFIHCNYLAQPPQHGSVIFCPRTHARFGHERHSFRDFLAAGVRIALGTDSLASNPDLDVLGEARFLHRQHPDVPGAAILRMATLSGAEALGLGVETGSLSAGKSADLVVVPVPAQKDDDPHRLVLASDVPVEAVLFHGQWTARGTP